MSNLKDLNQSIRKRLYEYRLSEGFTSVSMHINAIEIAVCLTDYSLQTSPQRSITRDEEYWFRAGYFIDSVLQNSEWSDLSDLYYELVSGVEKNNFFRQK